MKITINELENLAKKALLKYGHSEKEAGQILEVLMYAQLRGNNQGIVKLIGSGIPVRKEREKPEIVKETKVSALVDGKKTHAMIVMNMLTGIAIKKAKDIGIGIAGNFNTDESTGALGYYVQKAANQDLIGIAFSAAPFMTTAPYGSNEARFCTNPMAYGIPTDKDPILLDMSTSAIAYYGLIEAKTAGTKVDKVGYNKEGEESEYPEEIMSGAIKAFAGHKGSGLALVVQVLAGALVNADSFNNDSDNSGNLVLAVDPEVMLDKEHFKNEVGEIVKKVKSARLIDGVNEIYVPGERGNNQAKQNISAGEIDIEDKLLEELKNVAD